MWNDPIVEEVRRVRNAHAEKFGFDLKAIAADLRAQQQKGAKLAVSLPSKKPIAWPKAKAQKEK